MTWCVFVNLNVCVCLVAETAGLFIRYCRLLYVSKQQEESVQYKPGDEKPKQSQGQHLVFVLGQNSL